MIICREKNKRSGQRKSRATGEGETGESQERGGGEIRKKKGKLTEAERLERESDWRGRGWGEPRERRRRDKKEKG